MATERKDIITDDALRAPLDLADNVAVALLQNEKLLASFRELNTTLGAANSTGKVKKQVEELTLAEKELVKVQNQIAVAQAKNTDEYRKEEAQLQKVKKAIKEKTTLGDRDAKSVNAQNASYKVLRAALEANRAAYNDLAGAEQRASKEGQDLLRIIEDQDKAVKKGAAEVGKFNDNVGNYPTTMGKATAAFNTLTPSVSGFTQTILTATKATLAFLATPLGLFLGTIAVLLGPVISYLRNTGDGMDLVEKKTQGVKNAFAVLGDAVNEFGRQVLDNEVTLSSFTKTAGKFFSVVISGSNGGASAILEFQRQFPELAARMGEAAKAGEEFADAMDEIETRRAFQAVSNEKEENAIKRLIIQSKDRTKTEQERIDLIDQALDKESNLSLTRVKNAQDELGAVVNLAKSRVKLTEEFENEEEAALALAEALDKTDNQLRDQLLKSLVDLEKARGEDIALTEKLQNQRDALLDKAEEKDKKRQEDALKRAQKIQAAIFALEELRAQREVNSASNVLDRVEKELELEEIRNNHLLANDELLAEERALIEAKHQDNIAAIQRQGIADYIKEQEAGINKITEDRQRLLDDEIRQIQEAAIKAGTRTADTDKQILEAKKRVAEETIKLQIDGLEKILLVEGLNAEERAKIEEELAKLKIKLTDTVYQHLNDTEKESIENTRKTLETIKVIYADFANSIGALLGSLTERRLQNIDIEQHKVEEQHDRDVARSGDNARRKEEIEIDYQRKLAQLDKQRVSAQQRQARFDKVAGLLSVGINTAVNITKVFPNPVLMALAAALGVIQGAAIAAKPIPKYAHGVKSHPGGLAVVGDGGGAELIRTGGRAVLSPSSATLVDLPKGAEVLSHKDTMRHLALSNISPETLGTRDDARLEKAFGKAIDKLGKEILSTRKEISYLRVGSVVYEATKEGEELTKISRAASLGKWHSR